MSVVALTVPLELADGGAAYSGSISGVGDVIVVPTAGYNSISIQLTGTWVATVDFSVSNDGVNWVKVASETSNGLYSYATTGLYFKVSVSSYTSGTVDVLAYLRFQPVVDVLQADAGSVAQTATASGDGPLLNLDTLGYNSISVQLSGFWTADAQFQVSNDNVNWVAVQGYASNSSMTAIDTAVDNDIYVFPVVGRYFRINVYEYQSGPINVTAYLRTQSLAGLGEAMLSQAMDQSGMTPLNVTFPGVTGAGQQNAANSVPVALANEQVNDKVIFGKVWTQTTTFLNYNIMLPPEQAATAPFSGVDCAGYRTAYLHIIAGSSVSVVLQFEVSNDQLNWMNVAAYNLGSSTIAETFAFTANSSTSYMYGLPISARYIRLRCTSFTASNSIQCLTILRMTPLAHAARNVVSLTQMNGNNIPSTSTPSSYNTYGATSPGIPLAGSDKNYVRSEIVGAPNPTWSTYASLNGTWRQAGVNIAGSFTANGPNAIFAEDKVEPVNVRLERTTRGQDSVQDLLLQVLAELKALNYYTREGPMAIATALSTATPSSYASMEDDPENFYNDPMSFAYVKGN